MSLVLSPDHNLYSIIGAAVREGRWHGVALLKLMKTLVLVILILVGCGKEQVSTPPTIAPISPTLPQVASPALQPTVTTPITSNAVETVVVTIKYAASQDAILDSSSSFWPNGVHSNQALDCVITKKIDKAKLFELQQDYQRCSLSEVAGVMIYQCADRLTCGQRGVLGYDYGLGGLVNTYWEEMFCYDMPKHTKFKNGCDWTPPYEVK